MGHKPILSPIARPGRRYISGLIYLGVALGVVAALFLLRACVIRSLG
jgi:hypothetical protein